MTEKDRIISAIRVLAGDQGLYERERLEALREIAEEAERQRRWLAATHSPEAADARETLEAAK